MHEVGVHGVGKSDEARFSKKKCWGPNLGKKGPKWAKNEFFCLFLDKKSLEFASIAYGNRERWYLAGGSARLLFLLLKDFQQILVLKLSSIKLTSIK